MNLCQRQLSILSKRAGADLNHVFSKYIVNFISLSHTIITHYHITQKS